MSDLLKAGTQAAMESLPAKVRITAPALGATRLQNIRFVLAPNSFDGIVSGVILSIGRCAEDTAVIMLTGAAAAAGIPDSLLGAYEALPFYIYYISSQYMDQQELLNGTINISPLQPTRILGPCHAVFLQVLNRVFIKSA